MLIKIILQDFATNEEQSKENKEWKKVKKGEENPMKVRRINKEGRGAGGPRKG